MSAIKRQTKITAEKGKQELFITREFDAPKEMVFKAFTNPKLLMQWLGPRDLKLKIDFMHCKTGGSYRYINYDEKGNEFCFNGVIHEVSAPDRIIQTFEYEGLPERGHVSLDTTLFESLPNERTKVTIQSIFKSSADRDNMIKSGMERGVVDSHNRLDELFAKGI